MSTITKWVRLSFTAAGVSAKNCAYAHGVPPPSAAWGMACSLTLQSGVGLASGVAFIVHDYSDRGVTDEYGKLTYAMQRSAERDVSGVNGLSQIDLPRCDLSATLLFRISSDNARRLDAFASALPVRFGGGRVDWTTARIMLFDQLSDAMVRVAPGAAMIEHAMPDVTIDGLISKLSRAAGSKGWFTASLLGYQLLETPVDRPGARSGLPHAYADPLLGVVEWKSFYALRRTGGAGLTFWSPKWETAKTVMFQNQLR